MNIFEQYGIKEVADVCLYAIELDENDDEVYVPVLYLDTLKVSTVEETAEQTSARGGLGNPELIIWDYGKEITVTLEDALYSPASQGMTWGGKFGTKHFSLRGKISNIDQTITIPCRIEIENFSNFQIIGEKIYCWTVNLNIVSDDGLVRQRMEKVDLFYDTKLLNWSFTSQQTITNDDDEEILVGDVDLDGEITLKDVLLLQQWAVGTAEIDPAAEKQADVTGDGAVNIFDVVALKRKFISSSEDKYLVLDKENKSIVPPQEAIYEIDHALNNVYYLDRIEKCKATQTFVIDTNVNTLHGNYRYLEKYSQCELTVFIDPRTMQPYEPNTDTFTRKNGKTISGNLRVIKQHEIYYKWTRSKALKNTSLGHQIIVDAVHFPGTYRLVGETYSRSRKTGKDHRYQFEIPLCKMGTENSFSFEAEGDPTTFNMTLKVLRREDGVMMKLTQYSVENAKYDGYVSDSTNVIPNAEVLPEDPEPGSD